MVEQKLYTNVSVKTDAKTAEAEIKAEVVAEQFAPYIERALDMFVERVELKGFRKGKAPRDMIKQHVGEVALLEEAAKDVIATVYPAILADEKIDAIGQPEVHITKLAQGNPLEFTIKTALMPQLTYPDWKMIARKHIGGAMPDTVPTEDEVKQTLMHIRRERARIDAFEKAKQEEGDVKKAIESVAQIKDEELPELDDAFVATLGDFKTVDDFTAKIKANIAQEKEYKEKDKRRVALLDAITEGTKGAIPHVLIHGEEARIVAELEHALKTQQGKEVTLDDYLAHIKKTREEAHTEWHAEAERRTRLQLALNHIAETEKLMPDTAKIEEEVQKVLKEHPNANKDNVRAFVMETLQNRAVLEWLEGQA